MRYGEEASYPLKRGIRRDDSSGSPMSLFENVRGMEKFSDAEGERKDRVRKK